MHHSDNSLPFDLKWASTQYINNSMRYVFTYVYLTLVFFRQYSESLCFLLIEYEIRVATKEISVNLLYILHVCICMHANKPI